MKLLLIPLVAAFALVGSTASSLDVAAINASLASDAARPEADAARDAGRRPAEVLEFLGIMPGMEVVDLIAAAGYYTEVLSGR